MVFSKYFAEKLLDANNMNKGFEKFRVNVSVDGYYNSVVNKTYVGSKKDENKHDWYVWPKNASDGYF